MTARSRRGFRLRLRCQRAISKCAGKEGGEEEGVAMGETLFELRDFVHYSLQVKAGSLTSNAFSTR
jgi:hypothetical protein